LGASSQAGSIYDINKFNRNMKEKSQRNRYVLKLKEKKHNLFDGMHEHYQTITNRPNGAYSVMEKYSIPEHRSIEVNKARKSSIEKNRTTVAVNLKPGSFLKLP
jgi:uncharacterized protein (UPF0248 family)